MNLIGAVLVNLWVAGWAVAAVRAARKARLAAADTASRAYDDGNGGIIS
jgi:hypothetical protein